MSNMKKLVLINALALLSFAALGQDKNAPSNDKQPAQLMINGIPYNEYKAQQEIQKQQDASRIAALKPVVPDQFKLASPQQWNYQSAQNKTTVQPTTNNVVLKQELKPVQEDQTNKTSATTSTVVQPNSSNSREADANKTVTPVVVPGKSEIKPTEEKKMETTTQVKMKSNPGQGN